MAKTNKNYTIGKPNFRRLKGYAFDPSLSLKMDTFKMNQIVYKVKWESLDTNECADQGPGPVGEYLEIVDYDPTIEQFYKPVDLNDPFIIAQDGLEPSESNPNFHQQMVYAVAMTTIHNFEAALGRKIIWAPRKLAEARAYEEYVAKLRIYPHALRDANAYYSPEKKALLFGYFSATPANKALMMPESLVFTCLNHDIIAHETTHAILDGMHSYYNENTNPDVLAFHEAFADIVALFQHFTFPEVLEHQIAKTKGDLEQQNLLGQLAQEFGVAIGNYGSLRDAIGHINKVTRQWEKTEPNIHDYSTIMEPHARGSILVAAIFEAFISIYKSRIKDIVIIGTNGTGILGNGELHPVMVKKLAEEAANSAKHVLTICIRALDYCPPVDITFGDYLRAIITADTDTVKEDRYHYRLAFIDAFRRRGIYPKNIKTLSVESLAYEKFPAISSSASALFNVISEFLKLYREKINYVQDRKDIFNLSKRFITGGDGLHKRISIKFLGSFEFEALTGLVFNSNYSQFGIHQSGISYSHGSGPSFQIKNLRLVSRTGPDGNQINQIVISIVQRSGVIVKDGEFDGNYNIKTAKTIPKGGFEFRGGCTMIFDLNTLDLKYVISKPLLNVEKLKHQKREMDIERILNQASYTANFNNLHISEYNEYFGNSITNINEPFAFLHKH